MMGISIDKWSNGLNYNEEEMNALHKSRARDVLCEGILQKSKVYLQLLLFP